MRRRYAAEFIGTFAIVFAPVCLAATSHFQGGAAGLVAAALVSGLAVLAMIYAVGHISAAHFNPAITLGFAVARRFPWRFVLHYWTAQLAGAISAVFIVFLIFGHAAGTHLPADSIFQAVGMEVVLTFFLM